MKKLSVILLLTIISFNTFSQQTTSSKPSLTKMDYLKKSKKQNTTAWILLGSGIGISVIDFLRKRPEPIYAPNGSWITYPPTNSSELDKFDHSQRVVLFIGCATALASIPFFINAHKNKKKAMSLSFKNEKIPQIQKRSFVCQIVPSLTLKINL